MLRQACSKAAPVTGQLRILPKVADNGPGQSKYGPVIKERQKNGGEIGHGGLVRWHWSPVGGCLRSFQRLGANIWGTTPRAQLLRLRACHRGREENALRRRGP